MFLCLFLLIRKNLPFFQQIGIFARRIKKKDESYMKSQEVKHLMSSPKLLSKFEGVSSMVKSVSPEVRKKSANAPKSSQVLLKLSGAQEEEKMAKNPYGMKKPEVAKISNKTVPPKEPINPVKINSDVVRLPNATRINASCSSTKKASETDLLKSPSLFLRERSPTAKVTFCECGNPCDGENTQCHNCLEAQQIVEFKGWLSKKTKLKEMKKLWCTLLGKEIYFYADPKNEKHKNMRSLTGVFLKDELEEICDTKQVRGRLNIILYHINQ